MAQQNHTCSFSVKLQHKNYFNLLISFFAPFFANGMAVVQEFSAAGILNRSLHCNSCGGNLETKFNCNKLSAKKACTADNLSNTMFALLYTAECCFVKALRVINKLYKYSLVGSDKFYLFELLSQNEWCLEIFPICCTSARCLQTEKCCSIQAFS